VSSSSDVDACFERLLAGRPAAVAGIARRVRALARECVPDAVESCAGGDLGVGRGPGYSGLVFAVTPVRDGVRLGFAGGGAFDDPDGLLEGRGRVHRFVRLRAPADAERPELAALMRAAAARAG
jgi:hypothetical protein